MLRDALYYVDSPGSVIRTSEISGTVEAKRTTRWIKTAGIGAMVGSGAVLAASIVDNVTQVTDTPATAEYVATWTTFAIGALLLLAGAIRGRYGDEYGRPGVAGTALAGLSFLSMIVGGVWSAIDTASAVEKPRPPKGSRSSASWSPCSDRWYWLVRSDGPASLLVPLCS